MPPTLPTTGPQSWHAPRGPTRTHNGIDLAGRIGDPVYAADAGIVRDALTVYAPGFSGYGRTVTIDHDDGTHTLYAHLDTVLVQPGQPVPAGELLGTVGKTAFTAADPGAVFSDSAAHLHFEAAPDHYPLAPTAPRLDPVAYILAGRVHPRAAGGGPSAPSAPSYPYFAPWYAPPSASWYAPPRPPRASWAIHAAFALALAAAALTLRSQPRRSQT
jgi:murein DD-endopeptidase MepM/ murein hydrolase activator NlpD